MNELQYKRGGTQKDHYSSRDVLEVPCPLCGATTGCTLAIEHTSLGIKRCAGCSLIYTSPRVKEPEKAYWGDYEDYLAEAWLIFSGASAHHRDPNYIEELALVEEHCPSRGRFLDVGCNMGMLLRHARARGWQAVGVEPSPALYRVATERLGLEVHNCWLDELPAREHGTFDVVALSDVFEHVTEPRRFLRSVAAPLKPGGLLYIKVPNARWNLLKQRVGDLRGHRSPKVWDSYEHVVHYTDDTLRAMLEIEGFDPVVVTFARPVQTPVWHEYVGQYFQYPSPWVLDWRRHLGRAAFHRLATLERRLRRGSIGFFAQNLVVLARRPPET